MTRAQQLEQFLFSVKSANNNRVSLSHQAMLDGLSHAMGSTNTAVACEAASLLADKLGENAQ